jgi:hypothetical protein
MITVENLRNNRNLAPAITGEIRKSLSGTLNGITGYISGITGNVSGITGDVTGITGDVSWISGDVSRIRGSVAFLIGDVSGISGNVSGLIGDVSRIIGDVTGIRGDVTGCTGPFIVTAAERENGISIQELQRRHSIHKSMDLSLLAPQLLEAMPLCRDDLLRRALHTCDTCPLLVHCATQERQHP